MSKQQHSDEPSMTQRTFSIIGIVGTLLLFALIMAVAYLPKRPEAVDIAIVEARKATLAEVQAKQHEMVTSYAWVDQTEGIVRIPVEQAMKLVVAELQNGGSDE